MKARYCYRCGHEFKEGEGHHMLYVPQIDRLVPVCREDVFCECQRPGKAARQVVEYAKRQWEDRE